MIRILRSHSNVAIYKHVTKQGYTRTLDTARILNDRQIQGDIVWDVRKSSTQEEDHHAVPVPNR